MLRRVALATLFSTLLLTGALPALGAERRPVPDPSADSEDRQELLDAWESCNRGDAEGCTDLGKAYQRGKGVAKNYDRAADTLPTHL